MITNIGAYCKRLAKVLDVLVRNPIAFRHFIKGLGYSGSSWKDLLQFEARGSVNTHNRINKFMKASDNEFRLLHAKTRIVGKKFHLIKNNPGELLLNFNLISQAFTANGRSSTDFLFYWEMLCVMSFMNHIQVNYPAFRNILKGKKRPQSELVALGSSYGDSIRDKYVALFAN